MSREKRGDCPRFLAIVLWMTICGIFVFATSRAVAGTIHVPADQPTIQAGIDAAVDGDTVLIADGTYRGPGNRDLDFGGRAITVRSANGPYRSIIDCEDQGRGFIFQNEEYHDSILQGLTIRNGRAGSPGGAGIYCNNASPLITGNVIRGNLALNGNGGGIHCKSTDARISGNSISYNTSSGDFYGRGGRGGGIYCVTDRSTIFDNTIRGNRCGTGDESHPATTPAGSGGGIYCSSSYTVIRENSITANRAVGGGGGGIRLYWNYSLDPVMLPGNQITGNEITGNDVLWPGGWDYGAFGGGVLVSGIDVVVSGNLISGNSAPGPITSGQTYGYGGGLYCAAGTVHLIDNTISDNQGSTGGGVYWSQFEATSDESLIVSNLIIDNRAELGAGLRCGGTNFSLINNTVTGNTASGSGGGISFYIAPITVRNSILHGNNPDQMVISGDPPAVTYCDVEGGWPGEGNIDTDPVFTAGPFGDYYLSQTAAGQPVDSPCLDAGDETAADLCFSLPNGPLCLGWSTTRTDWTPDSGLVDMGVHFPTGSLVAAPGPGPSNPPLIRVLSRSPYPVAISEFRAYGVDRFGANVACGDVDGDGTDEILTGAGPGAVFGPHVRGFEMDGSALPGLSFFAYGTLRWGVNVAAGDFNGDGTAEILTGAGPGAVFGPHVRAFAYDPGTTSVSPVSGISFLAYGTNRWGVNVSAGDIDGDGFDEIVTGPGPGRVFGPHLRAWNVDGGTAEPIGAVNFFAMNSSRYGLVVACGDVDGDGIDEMISAYGPGPGLPSRITGWNYDGETVEPLPGVDFQAGNASASWKYGARVSSGTDSDGDGRDEIIVGAGPDPGAGPYVKVFVYDGSLVMETVSIDAFPGGLTHGANVAAGQF